MPSEARRVLITGANKGIGRATVEATLEAAEDTFVLLGARDAARGADARAAVLEAHPGWEDRLEVLEIDVSDDASVATAAEAVASRFGAEAPLYGIVNNAGIGRGASMRGILEVNTRGPKRVCDALLPLLADDGRVVNVSSASGPVFVAGCSEARRRQLTHPDVTWADVEALMDECLAIEGGDGDFEAAGFGDGNAYGLSKACLNALTIALARAHPRRTVNACTPGFIETDMTRRYAEEKGVAPSEMGMKAPREGTRASLHLLLGDVGGSGWYFGSDAERSPLDRYRAPGDPPYTGS